MNKKFTDLDELYNSNQEAIDRLYKTQLRTWEDLSQVQSEFANLWMECLNAQLQRVANAKNLPDIYAAEAGVTTEYSMKFSENIRKMFEIIANAQKNFMECCKPDDLLGQFAPAKTQKGKTIVVEETKPRAKVVE
jgi:Phasin protein.